MKEENENPGWHVDLLDESHLIVEDPDSVYDNGLIELMQELVHRVGKCTIEYICPCPSCVKRRDE